MLVRHQAFTEEATARFALIAIVFLKAFDIFSRDVYIYVLLTTPLTVVVFSLLDAALKGIYTDAIPQGS